jgi:hypothetical protein
MTGPVDPADLVIRADIAAEFDVTNTAVGFWVERADFPPPVTRVGRSDLYLLSQVRQWYEAMQAGRRKAEHGSGSLYRQGCRCKKCRVAHTARTIRRTAERTRLLAADPSLAPHGRASTYRNWGCRCRPCTTANSEYCAAYKRSRAVSP